jgi:hypothetical protein
MKKTIFYLFLVALVFASCYKSYIEDFDHTSIYIPQQLDVRTFVVGEGMTIKVGAELGGVRENKKSRNVDFVIDNSLITSDVLEDMKNSSYSYIKNEVASINEFLPMPTGYYSLSNTNTITIKPGDHTGTIDVKADSTKFLADPNTLHAGYVIPFYIKAANADTILEGKRFAVIALKYENMLFGNYLHGGVTTVKDPTGATIQTISYYTTPSQGNSEIWQLSTLAPNTLASNGYSNQKSGKNEIMLTLNGTAVTVSSAPGSTNIYEPNGESKFNGESSLQKRKILLNYKYVNQDGNTCYVQDTLTFRNRIRDGVNEWQN